MVKERGYQHPLAERVLHFIRQHHLALGQHPLLVAVSGGQDSVCLLHVLVKLQPELNTELHVAHLDHQLRGAESEADAQYVAELARQFGITSTVEKRDVEAYQAQQRLSLEEAAREVRYTFLAEVAGSIGAEQVAVGHTSDDHVETLLMHLIRGTGTRGLRGLQPISRWQSSANNLTIIRPLLQVSRQETADYCRHHQLVTRIDTSNFSLSPLRNRVRQQLLPLLQSYNPRIVETLLRTADIAADDLAFLEKEVARVWDKVVQKHEDTIVLDKTEFLDLPSGLQRHLLRRAIEDLLGSLKDIEARHIEEVMDALVKPAGRSLNLPGGLFFSVEYNQYLLGPDPAASSPFPVLDGEFVLKIPGEVLLPGWRVTASVIKRRQMTDEDDNFSACFDLDKAGDRLVVRSRQSGDRFQPLGMNQTKKLGEFMIDAKIPRAWRRRVPVVCSPHHILWVVGWRIDNRARVTENTTRVLCLKFKSASGA